MRSGPHKGRVGRCRSTTGGCGVSSAKSGTGAGGGVRPSRVREVAIEEAAIALRDITEIAWSPPSPRPAEPSHGGARRRDAVAVELAADLANASSLRSIRKRLLSGLVADLGCAAAATWTAVDLDAGLELHEQVGLPGAVADALRAWPPGALPDWLVGNALSDTGQIVSTEAPAVWGDRDLHLVAVPGPTHEVVGVFAAAGDDTPVGHLLVALCRTYASAVSQAYALRDNQRVIDALVDELRPGDVELPDGYAVGHLYRSATTGVPIGGDLYDWFRTDRGDLAVAVGDVSGKGVQAASRTAMTVHSLRALGLPGASPHVATTMLNTVMSGRVSFESFVTLVYLRLDAGGPGVDFVLAGHPPPILIGRDGVSVVAAEADLPVGVDPAATFTLHHTELAPGETLLLYTDGVTEARALRGGALFGTSGLVSLLEGLRHATPQQVADGVWRGVQQHSGGDTTDDVAVVALQRTR